MENELDKAIQYYGKVVEQIYKAIPCEGCAFEICKSEHSQLVEWLKELQGLEDFANFVAESVMSEDFEENSHFYAEVFCRKLHKIGFIEAEEGKWILNKREE